MTILPAKSTTLFISHASEDKADFVRPLAHALKKFGLKVWYDEFSLSFGGSLRRSIDRGLAECTAGIVVLSRDFFSKEWPQRELDALYSSEILSGKRIIPIWHRIDLKFLASVSPLLADRFAISSDRGVDGVAQLIAAEFPNSTCYTNAQLVERLIRQQSSEMFACEALGAACRHRFLLMNAFKKEYHNILSDALLKLSDDEINDFPSHLENWLGKEAERLRDKYEIPIDVYLTTDEPVKDENVAYFLEEMVFWTSGTLTRRRSVRLVHNLDLDELDEYFILLGVPNFSFSIQQRTLIDSALIEIGCGLRNHYKVLNSICKRILELDKIEASIPD